MFNGLTNIGKEYIAKCLAENKPITFTKVKIGDGLLDLDENAELLTDVKSLKKEVEILDKTQEGELTTLTILLDNSDIEVGYYPREIGIYVTDEGVEKLYWYINDGLETQWLCAANKYPIKFKQIINLMTTNLESVIVNWSGKNLFVDREFVEEKIKEKVRTFEIPTIAELQSRKNLKVGDIVEVLGYYTASDGAGHKRIIANEDDDSGVQLNNGLWANIIHNGEVNVSWFGAKGDGVTDDTQAIQKTLNKYNNIYFDNKVYIATNLTISDNRTIYFNNTTIKKTGTDAEPALKITGSYVNLKGNIKLIGNKGNVSTEFAHCLSISNNTTELTNICIENLYTENAQGDGLYIGSSSKNMSDIYIENLIAKDCSRHGFALTAGKNILVNNVECINCGVDYEPYDSNVEIRNIKVNKLKATYLNVIPQINYGYDLFFGDIIINNDNNKGIIISACDNIYFNSITIENSGKEAISFEIHHGVNSKLCKIGSLYIKNAFKTYTSSEIEPSLLRVLSIEKLIIENIEITDNKERQIDAIFSSGHSNPNVIIYSGNITSYRLSRYVCLKISSCNIDCNIVSQGAKEGSYIKNCNINCTTFVSYSNNKCLAHDNIITATTLQSNAKWIMYNNVINGTFEPGDSLKPTEQVRQLNSIYHLEKMKQENVYDDYITYMDEKTAYDKKQEKLEQERHLAYEQALKENPNLTYEEFISLQPMTLNLIEEPQPSLALQEFMKKYL